MKSFMLCTVIIVFSFQYVHAQSSLPALASWPMHDYDAARTSWVKDETTFAPPFNKVMYQLPEPLASTSGFKIYMLSYADSILYLGLGAGTLGNAVCAFDYRAGQILWTTTIIGGGGSIGNTPIITDNRIICGGQGADALLTGINRQTGAVEWTKSMGSMYSTSATLDGDRLYASLDSTYCLNPETGAVIWKTEHGWTQGATPAVSSKYVASLDVDRIVVRNKMTGSEIWSRRYASKNGLTLDDTCLYVSGDKNITSYNLETGDTVWQHTVPENINLGWLIANAMARDDQTIVYALWENADTNGVVRAIDKRDGSIKWTYTASGAGILSLTIINGIVYFCEWEHRAMVGLNMNDGSEAWRVTGDPYYTRAIYGNKQMFVGLLPDPLVGGKVVVFETPGSTGVATSVPAIAEVDIYPNPVRGTATVTYTTVEAANVSIAVYDALGREVVTRHEGFHTPGTYSMRIENSVQLATLPAGVYSVIVNAGSTALRKTMLIIK